MLTVGGYSIPAILTQPLRMFYTQQCQTKTGLLGWCSGDRCYGCFTRSNTKLKRDCLVGAAETAAPPAGCNTHLWAQKKVSKVV